MTATHSRHKPPLAFLPLAAILAGLATAQIIATAQVYRSNVNLHAKLSAVSAAGYLAVPNVHVFPSLKRFGTAARGGIFFTLTLGCGIALLCLSAAWTWDRLFYRKRSILLGLVSAWAACVILANAGGLDPWFSAYLLCEVPVVFGVTARWLSSVERKPRAAANLIHILAFAFLALLWAGQIDRGLFIDLRDSLLWSNSFGRKVNSFYYTYTLYAAEAFKTLDQKLLKTYSLEAPWETDTVDSLVHTLSTHDYLRVPKTAGTDLEIQGTPAQLVFKCRGGGVFQITLADFLDRPQTALTDLANHCDRHGALRRATFLCLLFAFPAGLYILLHGLFSALLYPFAKAGSAAKIASMGCLLLGAGIFVPFQMNRSSNTAVEDIAAALNSGRWQQRVAALRVIRQKGLDVARYSSYDVLRNSPLLVERYWLVRSLASSRQLKTYEDLIHFLDDPELNVRTMAMYALGQRGGRRAVSEILKRLSSSRTWYDQLYAYQALRKLGWKQPESNSTR